MKNIWSIICEKSSIDSKTNLLSIFNCIEEVKVEIDKTKMIPDAPLVLPVSLQLISYWAVENYATDNSDEVRVEFTDPKGKILTEFTNVLKAKKGEKRLRDITNIQGVPITEQGRYYYKIYQKNNTKFDMVTELPFDINLSFNQ